ncbi:MAG: hypothetical protein ABIJ96_11440 [Elusimicrobiota bacterium]
MIKIRVKCQHCGKSLMDPKHLIDSKPSIRLAAIIGRKKATLRLSAFYGSYRFESSVPLREGQLVRGLCPHCRKELKGSRICEKCEAAMIPLAMQEGGMVQICSRKGCKKHLIEFEDPEAEIRAFYAKYSTFFK